MRYAYPPYIFSENKFTLNRAQDRPFDTLRTGIIAAFFRIRQSFQHKDIMEAEQLNALTNQLQDLRARTAELRGYL